MAQRNPLVLVSGQQQQLQAADYANIGIPYFAFKNRLINGDFNVWQRGTALNTITESGTYYPDRWIYTFNGSGANVNSQRLAFTLGQTDVPDNPQYYLQNSVSIAATGQTGLYMSQRIEGVGTFSGQSATVSFWAKADTTRTLGVSLGQSFGTGGSPSSDVYTSGTTFTLSTSWAKYSHTFSVPSISGKTLGTNGDDYLVVNLEHPVNSGFTIDIARVQFEQGQNATQFEYRPAGQELQLCQRYFCVVGAANPGAFANTTDNHVFLAFPVTMRSVPTLSLTTSTPIVDVNGLGVVTGSGSTISFGSTTPTSSSVEGLINGFSANSSFLYRPTMLRGAYVQASSEL